MTTIRQRMPRDTAQQTYIRAGEMEVFRQLQRDATALDATAADDRVLAVGPFGRLRTDSVVDGLGKTRGAINHLWGSQDAYRAAVMHVFLDDETLGLDEVEYPEPSAFDNVETWIAAWAAVEIERGPRHGMQPENRYGLRWATWLGLVRYGVWSDTIAAASMTEYRSSASRFASDVLEPAFGHFGLDLRPGTTLDDVAVAVASSIEGVWLSASLSEHDPLGRSQTVRETLATTLLLIVRGATVARQ